MERNRLLKKAIISFEEYERLVKEGVQKDILEQRIDKAIKYIKNNQWELEENGYEDDWKIESKPILEILKGENK